MRPPSLAVLAFGIDAALVLVFVAIGRGSHGEDTTGFTVTLLPFLTGLLAGWLLRSGRPPLAIVRSGVVVWIATVVLGIALRALTGQGIAPAFIVVATLTLGVFLMGWRAVALLVVRLRARRQRAARPVDRARTPV